MFTFGTGKSSMGVLTVLLLMLAVGLVVGGLCHLSSKRVVKESTQFTKVNVGSIAVEPSIYDTTWAR
jgi:high-affinity Fe2+/Pb2+ permease